MKRGSAKAFDHNELIHEIWSLAMEAKIALWVERVPSKFNIADSPSRFEWQILEDLGRTWYFLHLFCICCFIVGRFILDRVMLPNLVVLCCQCDTVYICHSFVSSSAHTCFLALFDLSRLCACTIIWNLAVLGSQYCV